MKKLFVKCKLTDKFYNYQQDRYRIIANNKGLQYQPLPVPIHILGNVFYFDPECEIEEPLARELCEKREHIYAVSEPYEKSEPDSECSDARDEDVNKFGEVYLCKHCGWPFPRVNSRNMHERRWCKRKDD